MCTVERIAVKVAEALNARASVKWDDVNYGHPATVNHEAQAAIARDAAVRVVGEAGLRTGRQIMTMGGEDFSYFLNVRQLHGTTLELPLHTGSPICP